MRIKKKTTSKSVRLTLENDKRLKRFLEDNPDKDRTEVINAALECFLANDACAARRRF